jgi:hypothetical protein
MWWEWLFVFIVVVLLIPLVLAGFRRMRMQQRVRAILRD